MLMLHRSHGARQRMTKTPSLTRICMRMYPRNRGALHRSNPQLLRMVQPLCTSSLLRSSMAPKAFLTSRRHNSHHTMAHPNRITIQPGLIILMNSGCTPRPPRIHHIRPLVAQTLIWPIPQRWANQHTSPMLNRWPHMGCLLAHIRLRILEECLVALPSRRLQDSTTRFR